MGNFNATGLDEFTIYERTTDPTVTKWRSGRAPDGAQLYFTGITHHVITAGDEMFVGTVKKNTSDGMAFSKKEGRRRARNRAFGAYFRWNSNRRKSLRELRGLCRRRIKTYKGKLLECYGLARLPEIKRDGR